MAGSMGMGGRWQGSPWQKAMWGGAAALLAVPAVAMRFTAEVDWDGFDFLAMGLILAAACGAMEFGMRMSGHLAYRAGIAAAVGGGFLMVWINLAVGVLGGEANPANLMYAGVLLTGLVGSGLARFRAAGMARAMLAMAAATVLVAAVALATGTTGGSSLAEVGGVTLFFLGPWLVAWALFRMAAQAGGVPR